jgi:CRP-like cAMP-binding protein/DNA-binding NarL/FixJ family response regulator
MNTPNVLVVEDEAIVAVDIDECLQTLGYRVCGTAASADEAFDLAGKHKPDLVLMDIILRGEEDGIQAAERIKSVHDVPVVFLTAHADKATLDRAKITEPYGYVLKPFNERELRTVVEIALYKHGRDAERKQHEQASEGAGALPDFLEMIEKENRPVDHDQTGVMAVLRKVELFKQIGEDFIKAASSVCQFGLYAAGDFLALEGDDNDRGLVVVYGRVSLVKTSASGKDLIVELLPPLDPFGMLTTLEKQPYPFSVKAQIDSRVIWVPRVVLNYILDNYPDLSREFFNRILKRLRKAHDLSRALAHDLVEVRIASALLALVPNFCSTDEDKETFGVRMTRQELAELTGTTYETVSRVVTRLEREGLLDLSESGKVRIFDMQGLQAITSSMEATGANKHSRSSH